MRRWHNCSHEGLYATFSTTLNISNLEELVCTASLSETIELRHMHRIHQHFVHVFRSICIAVYPSSVRSPYIVLGIFSKSQRKAPQNVLLRLAKITCPVMVETNSSLSTSGLSVHDMAWPSMPCVMDLGTAPAIVYSRSQAERISSLLGCSKLKYSQGRPALSVSPLCYRTLHLP